MKKKTFIVQLLDSKKPNRKSFTQVEDANFYSNDTDASLVFIPHEDSFDFQTAKVVMYNRSDESLVERDAVVTTENGRKVASYELPEEIILHWGDWTAQPVFISGGEIYSGSIVPFSVIRYLMDNRPPTLRDVIKIDELYSQLVTVMDEISDKDVISAPEIILARGGFETLGDRLSDTTAQLAQTAKKSDTGWATLDIYTEEERAKLLGLEPGEINAVLGAGNVLEENIGNGQVTPIKTDFFDVKNNLFDSSRLLLNKSIDSNGDIIDAIGYWTTSYKVPVATGDQLNLTPSVYRVALYNSEGDFFSRSGTLQDGVYNVKSSVARSVAISGSIDPSTVMFNKGATLLPYEPYGAVIKSEHLPDISDLYNRIEDVESSQSEFEVIKKIDYEIGAINADGTNASGTNAYRTVIPFTMSEGGKLTVSDGYRAFIVAKRQNETIASAVWLEANSVYIPTEPVTISLMVRTSSNTLPSTIGEFVKVKNETSLVTYGELSDLSTGGSGSGNVVKYVKTTGSDSADGNTFDSAYRTPQKAINEGASQIFMERADYPNTNLTMANPPESLAILPYDYASHTSIGEGRKKIRFLGGEKIIGWTAQGSIFKKNMPAGVNFSAVFIDKTLPPMTTGSRPAPNAVMWESKDYELDYMLTPVLSVAEVEENQGSFYWDGTTTYMNPLDITNEFWLPKIAHGLIFDGVKNLTVSEVVADYYLSTTISAKKVNNLKLNHCESHHTAKSDGFSLDYSFGELNECKAHKNRNDGYNNHFEGHITLNNCEGINNFDDGASPHENATMTVYGGIYRGNGKGGVIPALGGTARVYNAILQDNKIGFHNATEAKGSISSGNLFIGNETGLRNDTGNNGLISVNDKFIDNTTDVLGEFTRY